MKARRDIYQAIADPTRRAIIRLIAEESLDIKTLTEKFELSQQAVSLHVKRLAECGLVRMQQRGRNRFCRAQLGKLKEVEDWVGQYRKYWALKPDKPEAYLEKLRKGRKGKQGAPDDRELRISQLLDARAEAVWEVWTKPEHLAQWWVPEGWSVAIRRMEVKPGGKFELVMRGEGMEIDTMSVFLEVKRRRKIVYRHLTTPKFTTTITFEARGSQTLVTWSVVFEMVEQFNVATQKHRAAEVLRETVERLGSYVAGN